MINQFLRNNNRSEKGAELFEVNTKSDLKKQSNFTLNMLRINPKRIKIRILLTGIIICCSGVAKSNPPGEIGKNQWIISFQPGINGIASEFTPSLSFLENEFSHEPAFSFDMALSHTFGKRWETGVNLTLSKLKGSSDLPVFSAFGNHAAFLSLYQAPVNYETESKSLYGFIRYYFREFTSLSKKKNRIDPFVEMGIGANQFKTQLNYDEVPAGEASPNIFKKGQGYNPLPGSSAQYTAGAGTLINFKQNWNLILSFNMDLINSDVMDAVHNYTSEGDRNHAKTLLTRLKVGVAIPLSNSVQRSDYYMPWAPGH